MSWSVSVIGTPEKINAYLDEYAATLSGASKTEFDEAKPHLQGIVSQNMGAQYPYSNVIKLDANGHANFDKDGSKTFGSCSVQVQSFYTKLAI